jgi:hypothetical protein
VCVTPTTDVNNCGACGTVCPARANARATCASGTCGITCQTGFGNCNGNNADGCEVDTNTNTSNCGACGTVCPARANAATTCQAGTCGFTCNTGFANCDGNAGNGCEVNLQTDASNCGTCGNRCSGSCNAGSCGCLSGGRLPPNRCVTGTDPFTGAPWIICRADCNTAWVNANSSGRYHANFICQQLGYRTLGNWDGTCGNVCGYCEGSTSCSANGNERMGRTEGPNCGSDSNGGIYCNTVMWQCLR